ncbi:hypothetical protein [Psychromonas sp. KJ10-2]|uniref:hypothetical protein n=1 Tax=Psychromonas sp. KJ10-2 TaxID=3391822 RepID=UPI0039B4F7D4
MGLAKNMPFDEPPKLEEKYSTLAIFSACKGENRALKHLLTEALKQALICKEYLENKHFIFAFDKLYPSGSNSFSQQKTTIENPFKQDIKDIKIYEVSKNSSYNPNAIDPEDTLTGREFSLVG